MRKRFLTYSIVLLTLFSGMFATAQVSAEKSRLRIGENPKSANDNISSTLSAYIVAPSLKKGISFNKSQAVNDFYRQLLLNNSSSKSVSVAKAVMSETTEDALFSNAKLHVSNIYPNPANAFANVDYDIKDASAKVELTFYDAIGRKLSTQELVSFDKSLRIDTRNWDSGFYMYQLVLDGKKVATKRLLVRHN